MTPATLDFLLLLVITLNLALPSSAARGDDGDDDLDHGRGGGAGVGRGRAEGHPHHPNHPLGGMHGDPPPHGHGPPPHHHPHELQHDEENGNVAGPPPAAASGEHHHHAPGKGRKRKKGKGHLPPGQQKKLINGVVESFYAPDPKSDIAPHVLRRIMRFCTKHPNHAKCRNHPEWIVDSGELPNLPGLNDEILQFPKRKKFKIPGVPKFRLKRLLEGVPDEFIKKLPPGRAKKLNQMARQKLLNQCGGGMCKKQKPEFLNTRATLAELESVALKNIASASSIEAIDNGIEVRQHRVFEVKKALLRQAGLEEQVDPANDGLFQQDILLTETQSNALLNQFEHADEDVVAIPDQPPELITAFDNSGPPDADDNVANETDEGGSTYEGDYESESDGDGSSPSTTEHPPFATSAGRVKRAGNSLFLEISPTEKWPINDAIQFVMDQSLAESDKSAVRAAIQEIQSKSCLHFQESDNSPSGPHLRYIKYPSPTFCGTSYVGRVSPLNPIYLSFMCGNAMGVAVHETLHALGLQHEQVRPDRDNYITIQWDNMDPMRYDMFAVSPSNKYSSYGIQYDFGSIMQYESKIAARQFGLKTMTAKMNPEVNDAKMGQRNGMSESDVEALKRMYCKPPDCTDNNVYCGVWATQQMCYVNGQPHGWMTQNCRKSCEFC